MQLVLLAHVEATLSAAHAAPVRALKQFKLPTANSEPRSTTNGSDGNLWFTLGGENANVPSKIGRITPAGVITEFGSACEFCTVTDIIQGPSDVLYYTSNNPVLGRITTSGEILYPIEIPNSNRPDKLHADKGYDFPRCRRFLRKRGIRARIARWGVESSEKLGRHRWVVERTLAWLSRYRRLRAGSSASLSVRQKKSTRSSVPALLDSHRSGRPFRRA